MKLVTFEGAPAVEPGARPGASARAPDPYKGAPGGPVTPAGRTGMSRREEIS
jgi:hypothetical protein